LIARIKTRTEIGFASDQETIMAKAKKKTKPAASKKKTSKRKRLRHISSQTKQPFEQDAKRRIGQYGGTGEPPIMK